MSVYSVFLTVVCVVRNEGRQLDSILQNISARLELLVSDYELIVVDNASDDESVTILKNITDQNGLPNIQVFALTKVVDTDTASWVGLEGALGDFVAVFDPLTDDISFLPQMLDKAVEGVDVVFAFNQQKPRQSLPYRTAYTIFNVVYAAFGGIHLDKDAPHYRLLSRRVVNFILQHPQPALSYRHLPATGGFPRVNMTYSSKLPVSGRKNFGDSVDLGMRLLVSTTSGPMRLVAFLSLFGAVANLIYSLYVVAVGFFKADVAPGWVSLSLQQSGMFFLMSLVLLVLGEYILQMASLSNEGPPYYVGQEFTSSRMTHRKKLNIEETVMLSAHVSDVTISRRKDGVD